MYTIEKVKSEYLKGISLRYSVTKDEKLIEYIENKIYIDIPHKEKVYCYINNITPQCKNPKCSTNKIPKFENFKIGYKDYCSVSCSVISSKELQEESRIANIQEKISDMSVQEIIYGLYKKTIKIQKWRDIGKLSEFRKFHTMTQMYKHEILKENQICEYCNNVYDYDKGENRKCNCLLQEEKIYEGFRTATNKEFLSNFIEHKFYINYRDGYKRGLYSRAQEEYRKRFKKISNNIPEDLYCRINNITPKDKEFINMEIGYKKDVIDIDFSKKLQDILSQLKKKYTNYIISNEFQYWILHIDGTTVKDKIKSIEIGKSKYSKEYKYKEAKNIDIFNLRCELSDVTYEGNNQFICRKCKNKFWQANNIELGLMCRKCHPVNTGDSKAEYELMEFIREFHGGSILHRSRQFGPEFDIYLPEEKIAIEYNGLYWHSSRFKEKKYHLNKTKIAEDNNIQLIHIFENEWVNKKDIVKSILKAKLGFSEKRIYARKCEIRDVSSKASNEFLENNHIQGKDNSPLRYGLYYEDELVQIVTFKRTHRSKEKYMELKRSASKLGYSVVGGFSKLLKYGKNIIKEDIITFADRRYSYKDNVYSKIGEYIDVIPPNHFYINGLILEGREKYQKHKLKDIFENFDSNITAIDNCHNNDVYEIYDCGNWKYRL